MIFGVSTSIITLLVLMVFIFIYFLMIKRPIYEVMLLGFIITIIVSGRWDLFITNLLKPSESSLFFAIVAFLLLAHLLDATKVLLRITDIILSVVGRFRGGAGYLSLAVSTFMAALSGTGPGNVAATGVFTIPSMIKTGFPRKLAANIEMTASSLGPMLPPSGTLLLAYGILEAFLPENQMISISHFWLIIWAMGIWFILQRFLMTWYYCWKYNVKRVPEDQIKPLGETIKFGWPSLLLPLIILGPFVIDASLADTIENWVSVDGYKAFTDNILVFIPGIAALYVVILSKRHFWKGSSSIYNMLKDSFKKTTPVAATVYFSYSIAYTFSDIKLDESLASFIVSYELSSTLLIFGTVIFFSIIAMILPGSGTLALFGGTFLAIFANVGIDPILVAAILPALTGALSGMVPPVAVALYTAIGIANSDVGETMKMSLVWIAFHLIVCVFILLGILPIFVL